VVDGVSQQVHQRVAQLVDDGLVQFGVLAMSHQLDLLAQLVGQVSDEASEAIEGGADGQHAHAQGAVAQG